MSTKQETPMQRRQRLLMQSNVCYSCDDYYPAHSQGVGIYKQVELDVVYPVDPRTGFPSSDVAKILRPDISPTERETIMSRLTAMGIDKGSYLPSDMSDSDIMSLIPPRYLTDDAVDVQLWRDYLGNHVLPGMNKDSQPILTPAPTEDNNDD